ncbi:C39 family peptidase [Ruminococcaceae bacterium OttesenSCG-928-D13]|nr:C39 family peptidase [Ruminococcaceae bacterium OttesenSCG-928-D13]
MKRHGWVIFWAVLATAAVVTAVLLFTPLGRGALAWAGGDLPDSSVPPPENPAPPASSAVIEADSSSLINDPSAAFWKDCIHLYVELVTQTPELPNGCEATSLTMVLNYLGFEADKLTIAYDYIPRQDFEYSYYSLTGGNPETVYAGDPATDMGFYCFPPVVAEGANLYLEAQGSDLRARDISGADESQLVEQLLAGRPVVLWKTLYSQPAETREDLAWIRSDTGELYIPYVNLHVVVLHGFDADYFYMNDPYGEVVRVERELVMAGYEELGSRALVITED